jgi:hypothetical protein
VWPVLPTTNPLPIPSAGGPDGCEIRGFGRVALYAATGVRTVSFGSVLVLGQDAKA